MIETIFFRCYYSYLKGDFKQTKLYYDILREEFKNKVDNDIVLKPYQFIELKKIKNAIATGSIALKTWVENKNVYEPGIQSITPFTQDELVRKITQNIGQLNNLLQDDLYLYNLEHPCGEYGYADVVLMGRKTVYPIEVKKDQGRHDLIGQIHKYDLYHKFLLHYKLYEKVQAMTICKSYETYTLKTLKELSYIPIIYYIDGENFLLRSL